MGAEVLRRCVGFVSDELRPLSELQQERKLIMKLKASSRLGVVEAQSKVYPCLKQVSA